MSGLLRNISVGNCGVWGVNKDNNIYFKGNTFNDPDNAGAGRILIR